MSKELRIDPASGPGRFLLDMSKYGMRPYSPYPFQARFHGSGAPYGFLGGAAGPGKTTCALMEQFIGAHEFSNSDGPQVHDLALRRTFPKLESTVITRFRELFPPSVYKKFNETKSEVTWKNGATLKFGSMQYEYNAWDYQGQWRTIYYDELCEFTFKQWMATSAWNRCPVSPQTRKFGSGNPIGIGAVWVEDLFVKHVPCMEMDASQKRSYDPKDYPYFEGTYLDNPVYANDPIFLKNLEAYPEAIRDALKFAIWGAAGGYFRGVWDEAEHVFPHNALKRESWWKHWISGNWGFAHPFAYYKHCMDDEGVVYTYDELFGRELEPENLAKLICDWAREDGQMPQFQNFAHLFDANASKNTATMGGNSNSVNNRMIPTLRLGGIPDPHESTRDKLGRDTLMRERLRKRIHLGEDAEGHALEVPSWQISDRCTQLRRIIPIMKADETQPEKIEATTDGTDSPLQGAGYGLYAIFGKPALIPKEVQLQKVLESAPDNTAMHLRALRFEQNWQKAHPARGRNPVRWRRQSAQ
jgi:hypothetical protein